VQISVNGEEKEVSPELTVRGLIELLGLTDGPVAVERNREVVPRAEHRTTRLHERDTIEIVHLVGGG
jgi:sulfur carrier protein